ncbi:hypothetical protein L195_g060118, partial [Trifolium pratense]
MSISRSPLRKNTNNQRILKPSLYFLQSAKNRRINQVFKCSGLRSRSSVTTAATSDSRKITISTTRK